MGPLGSKGPRGPMGLMGPMGSMGPKGAHGAQGTHGPHGAHGAHGAQGPHSWGPWGTWAHGTTIKTGTIIWANGVIDVASLIILSSKSWRQSITINSVLTVHCFIGFSSHWGAGAHHNPAFKLGGLRPPMAALGSRLSRRNLPLRQ